MRINLSGKKALVTGGSRGLGSQIAQTLAEAGADVVITYKDNYEAALATVAKMATSRGNRYIAIYLDLNDLEPDLVAILREAPYDVLVNNAGVNHPAGFLETTWDNLTDVMATNVLGPFELTRQLMERLNDRASIIWVGSSSADTGGPVSTHYSGSKSALHGISRGVALAGAGRGIRSNVVSPGYLVSPMAEAGMADPAVAKLVEQIPLGRLGEFGEVANLVCFLASDLASYVTGQIFRVDGGLVLGA